MSSIKTLIAAQSIGSQSAAIIEFHLLVPTQVGCTNRDLDGKPKTAIVGGTQRLRESSQSWKRAIRDWCAAECPSLFNGISSKIHYVALAPMLREYGCPSDLAERVARVAMDARTGGDTLIYLGDRELMDMALFLSEKVDSKKHTWDSFAVVKKVDAKAKAKGKDSAEVPAEVVYEPAKDLLKGIKYQNLSAVDIALFGRMLANEASMNAEAACNVAHSISTHAVIIESDFFTGMDGRTSGQGSAHMGNNEFSSATMYKYICLDLGQLKRNLPQLSDEDLCKAINVLANALIVTQPNGRQTTMASRIEPVYAAAIVRSGSQASQVSLDEAIESQGGFNKPSVALLKRDLAAKELRYGSGWGEISRGEYGDALGLSDFLAGIQAGLK